jgi:hypothetical protein
MRPSNEAHPQRSKPRHSSRVAACFRLSFVRRSRVKAGSPPSTARPQFTPLSLAAARFTPGADSQAGPENNSGPRGTAACLTDWSKPGDAPSPPTPSPSAIAPQTPAPNTKTWIELVTDAMAISSQQNGGKANFGRTCQPELKVCITAIIFKGKDGTDMMMKAVENMVGKQIGHEICSFNSFGDVRTCIDWETGSTHRDMQDSKGNCKRWQTSEVAKRRSARDALKASSFSLGPSVAIR